MTQPLAVLNDEEMHWLDDLGLPNQRRWLNHRNSVTNTAERFPPPPRIVAQDALRRKLFTQSRKAKPQRRKGRQEKSRFPFRLCGFALRLCVKILTESELAGAALFIFEAGADFQQAIEHFGTLGAACGEL